MTREDGQTETSRRRFLGATAAAGVLGGLGGIASAQATSTTFRLGAKVAGWQGRKPGSISGAQNPTLTLQPGKKYRVEWTNLDGAPHNFTIQDGNGSAVASTETMSEQGATRTLTFTASEEMAEYICTVHPATMNGEISVGGGTTMAETTRQGDAMAYDWREATWDSYWYSLYNMNSTIAVSGNGVVFPQNEEQRAMFEKRLKGILKNADVERPPVKNPNPNMAPFTTGDPHFTRKPVAPFTADVSRINASTMAWDTSKSSGIVSPASVAWTHLKGVTWAKNFQAHFDVLPKRMAPKFRSQFLATIAQVSVGATLVDGGPDGNGLLTKNGDDLLLVSGMNPKTGEVVDPKPKPMQHAAMLWFLSDLTSLATGGWYGYVNPEPLIPAKKLQQLTDGMAKTVMNAFPPEKIVGMGSTRDLGVMLGAVGWYGTHAGGDRLRRRAADYANALADLVAENVADDGRVEGGAPNQAATQGAVGQGLLWASQIQGVDRREMARPVLDHLLTDLWDPDGGTFADGTDGGTYTITARDAGDITGGVNAADAVLGLDGTKEVYAAYFDGTFNRGRLQRAERPQSRNEDAEYTLPLPQNAGGKFGQAAVYNTAVEYDTNADEWTVTEDEFTTAQALYLANQDIWTGQWAGDFYDGRGVPGKNDTPGEAGSGTTTRKPTEGGRTTREETTAAETTREETTGG